MHLIEFSLCSFLDLECILTVICNLVTKPKSLEEKAEIAKLISSKVCQQANDKPVSRLKMYTNLVPWRVATSIFFAEFNNQFLFNSLTSILITDFSLFITCWRNLLVGSTFT